ncbi:MAG: YraN family protein [Clostridiales bacterium]|nr:YraN family protein [Clostridiales bacterium]
MNNHVVGILGEKLAVKYLKKNGYKILENNYKNKIGEIDIICLDKISKETVFIEVKSRETLAYGLPSEAVDFKKQKKIRDVASLYLLINKKYDDKVRFDVLEIVDKKIYNHIKYAF